MARKNETHGLDGLRAVRLLSAPSTSRATVALPHVLADLDEFAADGFAPLLAGHISPKVQARHSRVVRLSVFLTAWRRECGFEGYLAGRFSMKFSRCRGACCAERRAAVAAIPRRRASRLAMRVLPLHIEPIAHFCALDHIGMRNRYVGARGFARIGECCDFIANCVCLRMTMTEFHELVSGGLLLRHIIRPAHFGRNNRRLTLHMFGALFFQARQSVPRHVGGRAGVFVAMMGFKVGAVLFLLAWSWFSRLCPLLCAPDRFLCRSP